MMKNLSELADLVVVRNHLATLLDMQWRTIKNSDKFDHRQLNNVITNLDNKFLSSITELAAKGQFDPNPAPKEQLKLDFDGKNKASKIKRVTPDE